MPDFVLDAFEWSFAHDLASLLNAASYEAKYQKTDAAKGWDNTTFDGIELYQGEDDPDLIIINATFDGMEAQVVRGVVDRSSRSQNAIGVVGVVAGRDRMALVLDRFPAEAFTLQGISVVNNVPVAGLTYREAIQQVATEAGLGVIWQVGDDDYDLGKSIPVTTDQTFGQILAQLLGPWHFSRKYSHDAWIEGNNLRIVRRDLGAAAVEVPYHRLRITDYHKTVLPAVNDVRVEGATYQTLVNEPGAFGLDDGYPGVRITEKTVTNPDAPAPAPAGSMSYTETTAQHYDSAGRLFRIVKTTQYADLNYTESEITDREFVNNEFLPSHNQIESEEYEKRVTNFRTGFALNNTLVKSRTKTVVYFDDNGDVESEDDMEIAYETASGSPVSAYTETKRIITTKINMRSLGQLSKTTNVVELETSTGKVKRTFTVEDLGPFKLSATRGSSTPLGKRQEEAQISCGPEDSKRLEQSDLIGDEDTACLLRTRLTEEHGLAVVDIQIAMLPSHNIKAGRRLQITGVPAWFDVDEFYILSTNIRKGAKGAEQVVRGLAFITL